MIFRFPLISSVVSNLVLLILVVSIFTPKFMTTDDLRMSFIISGKYGMLEASDYVLFSNVLIGKLLKFLYSIFNSDSLYGYYLLTLLFFANTAVNYLFVKKQGFKMGNFYFLLFFFSVSIFMILNLQFTIVACFLATVGVLFIASWNNLHEKKNLYLYLGCAFLLTSSLVRFDSFILILLLSTFYFLYDFLKLKRIKLSHYFLGAIVGLAFLLQQYSVNYYNASDRFYEFNAERAKITDYGLHERLSSEELSLALKQANWSNNDLRMLNNWFFSDTTIYSIENTSKFTKQCGTGLKEFKLSKLYLIDDIKENYLLFLQMLLFLMILIVRLGQKKGVIMNVIFCFLLIIGLLSFMFFYMRNPPLRIFFPCIALLIITPLLFLQDGEGDSLSSKTRKFTYYGFLFLFVIISSLFVSKNFKVSQNLNARYAYLKDFKLRNKQLTNYFIFDWGGFPYDRVLPIESNGVSAFLEKDMKVLSLGTFQRTNDVKKMLLANNINNVYLGLLTDKACVFINKKASNKRLDYLKKFYEGHLNMSISVDTLISESDFYGFKIHPIAKDSVILKNN
jgi:hypothetical protein